MRCVQDVTSLVPKWKHMQGGLDDTLFSRTKYSKNSVCTCCASMMDRWSLCSMPSHHFASKVPIQHAQSTKDSRDIRCRGMCVQCSMERLPMQRVDNTFGKMKLLGVRVHIDVFLGDGAQTRN